MNYILTISIFAFVAFAINIYLWQRVAREENLSIKNSQYFILACLYVLVNVELLYSSQQWAFSVMLLSLGLLLMCLITGTIDFFSYYIYDIVLLGFSIAHLGITLVYYGFEGLKHSIVGAVVGFVFYGLIYFLAKLYYKKEAFGFGDVLFLAAIGVVLGAWWTFIVGVMAFYLALILILLNKLVKRKTGLKSEIPFGPAMALAVYLFVLHQNWVFALYDGFQKLVGN